MLTDFQQGIVIGFLSCVLLWVVWGIVSYEKPKKQNPPEKDPADWWKDV